MYLYLNVLRLSQLVSRGRMTIRPSVFDRLVIRNAFSASCSSSLISWDRSGWHSARWRWCHLPESCRCCCCHHHFLWRFATRFAWPELKIRLQHVLTFEFYFFLRHISSKTSSISDSSFISPSSTALMSLLVLRETISRSFFEIAEVCSSKLFSAKDRDVVDGVCSTPVSLTGVNWKLD